LNFLAHLLLAGDEDELRLGAMLGDFVRGKQAAGRFDKHVWRGIMLHRHIDAYTDTLPAIEELRREFQPPFRRFSGIIIDLAIDHELAKRWDEYSEISLPEYDRDIRDLLARHASLLPEPLVQFMKYADRRGLFAAYREKSEILHSLRGLGRRLSRENPLNLVGDIWNDFQPLVAAGFDSAFREIQCEVRDWLKSTSTMTGS